MKTHANFGGDDVSNAECIYDTLKDDYELNDDNAASVRWAMSFADEYAEYVQEQSRIVIESIRLGQSTLSLGELMRPLFNATHKLTTHDVELDLPGVTHFVAATRRSMHSCA
jgi:hypothetical protein